MRLGCGIHRDAALCTALLDRLVRPVQLTSYRQLAATHRLCNRHKPGEKNDHHHWGDRLPDQQRVESYTWLHNNVLVAGYGSAGVQTDTVVNIQNKETVVVNWRL